MNERIKERIKELWEQSTGAAVPAEGFYSSASKYNIEKFAELIVQECLSVIEEMNPHDPERDIDDIFDEVDKHFGVEN